MTTAKCFLFLVWVVVVPLIILIAIMRFDYYLDKKRGGDDA